MGWAYYNENNEFACAFLAELMQAGVIADGVIDGRSITDVQPEDLKGFTQCHFFAGQGGWSYALRLAGVPDDRRVWTASCPCQPFSVAGKQKGEADERHLWPELRRLIPNGDPPVLFGEQVASAAGKLWLSGVRADVEALGYVPGSADLCAAGIGAPHIRQRLYWVAYRQCDSGDSWRLTSQPGESVGASIKRPSLELGRCSDLGRLEYDPSYRWQQRRAEPGERSIGSGRGEVRGLGDSDDARLQGWSEHAGEHADQCTPWSSSIFVPCLDDRHRRIPTNEAGEPEPSLFPLAHGFPNRVGILRCSGNAIVPWLAAEFILACEEAQEIFRALT